MDLDRLKVSVDTRRDKRYAKAKAAYDLEIATADAEHAQAIQSMEVLRSAPVMDALRILLPLSEDLEVTSKADCESAPTPPVQEESESAPESHGWKGLRPAIREYAQDHSEVTMPEIAEFLQKKYPAEAASITRLKISDELYKMTHRTREFVVQHPGTGRRPGIWRVVPGRLKEVQEFNGIRGNHK